MICLIFRQISKKQILQKFKVFGNFFIIILEKYTFRKKKFRDLNIDVFIKN